MYFPCTSNPTHELATMQRTFYPKHTSYFGDGSGRDLQIILNTGGLNRIEKQNMGHTGVQLQKYNSNVTKRVSPAPRKEATTFYYQSDGSGRDSYILKNNGGLRFEYNNKNYGDRIFRDQLRSEGKSPLMYFKNRDSSDITNYLNWESTSGRRTNSIKARIQKDVVQRLTTGSPNRETAIEYVLGTGKLGEQAHMKLPIYQGMRESYKSSKKHLTQRRSSKPEYGKLNMSSVFEKTQKTERNRD